MQQKPSQPTYNRSIDAEILEIARHVLLNTFNQRRTIPGLHA
jgi:hypothetical protein